MLLADMSNEGITEMTKGIHDGAPTSRGSIPNDSERDNDHFTPSFTAAKHEKFPLIELRNGKVFFRQKALSCEKMSETMQEIVKFRDLLEERAKQKCPPLQNIPDEHMPLIAKLVHESDKTITSLTKHIQGALQPEELEADGSGGASITLSAIESAIVAVADRINYGVDWTEKISAPLSIWRWEVKEQKFDLLPKTGRDKFETRIAERTQAKKYLRALFDDLPQSEKDSLTKGGKKAKGEGANAFMITDANKQTRLNSGDGQWETNSPYGFEETLDPKKAVGRPRKEKVADPERTAKEREKEEKKAAREEKERKEKEAQNKSRSIMSAFFTKPKASNSKLLRPGQGSLPKNEPSSSKSDFGKTFKPFVVKKDATLAPINWFKHQRKDTEVIVIDQDSSNPQSGSAKSRVELAADCRDPHEFFSEFIEGGSSKPRNPRRPFKSNGPYYKTSSTYCVRGVFSRLSEAEVLGDISAVRSLQTLLRSRSTIPGKVLIFHEDTRPGYFGTFTKSSTVVGPRTPFAKDTVALEYSYDSGEDWEEEEEGGDDLMSLNGSEAGESSDLDSDLDDWLVDDDDNDLDPGTPLSERDGSLRFPPSLTGPEPPVKRKATVSGEKKETKRRKVVPLVPFSKGPCWEVNVGKCEFEPFKQYRIQLFNDTPFPVDPFMFVSVPAVLERSAPPKLVFAVPVLHAHAEASGLGSSMTRFAAAPQLTPDAGAGSDVIPSTSSTSMFGLSSNTKRKAAASLLLKNPFPDALLPYLADKIAALASATLPWLVESLYQDLKAQKVKKSAIEAKVREVGEKCPVKRVWVVKEEVLRSLGRASAISNGREDESSMSTRTFA